MKNAPFQSLNVRMHQCSVSPCRFVLRSVCYQICLHCRCFLYLNKCNILPLAVCDIGSASFKYDMRRLSEILAFPRAWYRRSIARRLFLGDQTINLPGDLLLTTQWLLCVTVGLLSVAFIRYVFTTLLFCRKYPPALQLLLCQLLLGFQHNEKSFFCVSKTNFHPFKKILKLRQ